MKPVVIGLLLSVFFRVLSVACSCLPPTFEAQIKASTAVFTGKVVSSKHNGEQLEITFELDKRWKGPSVKNIVVHTSENTASCGYPFEANRVYLVYASGKEKLEVSLCSRTKPVTEAKEDLDQLEVSTSPKEPARDPFTTMKGERFSTNKSIPRQLNITNAVIVGITKKSDGYIALIRGTNNKVYFLKPGDKLHDGVIQKIDKNSVTFRQYKGSRSVLVRKQLRPFPDE